MLDLQDPRLQSVFQEVSTIISVARGSAARSVNALITASYWLIGHRIVEFEQSGDERAEYGAALIERLSEELTLEFGRGFSRQNLQLMRSLYLAYSSIEICQTASGKFTIAATQARIDGLLSAFPLPWSAYTKLLAVKNVRAREFYEKEALREGWTVRQIERQINSQFYERTALSKNKAALLAQGKETRAEDLVLPDEQIKDPFVLEFLDLKDEYSESDLEEALIERMEDFLLELGSDFCFLNRQKRLRIGNEWFSVDLIFFHRRLQCLVIIDLQIGKFTHADAGRMHLYLNYAREHWVQDHENPPVGLILCAEKDESVAKYALEGLPNKVMAAKYRATLPDEDSLALEIERTRQRMDEHNGPEQYAPTGRRFRRGQARRLRRFADPQMSDSAE